MLIFTSNKLVSQAINVLASSTLPTQINVKSVFLQAEAGFRVSRYLPFYVILFFIIDLQIFSCM